MNSIGGYFELELQKGGYYYHDTPYAMKSGRSALHYILTIVKPELVYIPYYICNAVLEPFEVANIKYKFYAINPLFEPKEIIELKEGEYFLYVNYLDLKRNAVGMLSEKYKDKLIVDCSLAFFMKGNGISWFFNSCRKFFGVPDGAYIYPPDGIKVPVIENQNEAYITDHLLKRFNGHVNEGYESFLKNEIMADSSIYAMSKLTEYLLSGINYKEVIEKRIANYDFLHSKLKQNNCYNADLDSNNVPMFYPLLLDKSIDRSVLFNKHIYISQLWKAALQHQNIKGFEFEKQLTNRLWPLPIDHRYSLEEMELICGYLTNVIR